MKPKLLNMVVHKRAPILIVLRLCTAPPRTGGFFMAMMKEK